MKVYIVSYDSQYPEEREIGTAVFDSLEGATDFIKTCVHPSDQSHYFIVDRQVIQTKS